MYRYIAVAAVVLVLAVSLPAQIAERGRTSSDGSAVSSPLVTAVAAKDHVRFTALALTQKIRLEVLSQTGEPLFDSGHQPGNRLEWQVKDQQGSELRDGLYGCLVTVADLYGQVSERRAIFHVKDGAVSFDTTNREPAAAAEDRENLTILRPEEPSPFTLVSHDGKEGWVESASGGLSFYAGSLSRNRDSVPHLRLTPEGNLGIGMAEPAAKLDVAGTIRASDGFQFSDGTVLKMERGLPVLVIEDSRTVSGSKNGTVVLAGGATAAGKTTTRTIRLLAANGGINPFYANEIGNNTWFGDSAAGSITSGVNNSFFGYLAGDLTTAGRENTFVGSQAGRANVQGGGNSFFGFDAGELNDGNFNSFYGYYAGRNNSTGWYNSTFGVSAGRVNTAGSHNSIFGNDAGYFTTGSSNSIFGSQAGAWSTSASGNSFFGAGSGFNNGTAVGQAFFGYQTGYSTTGDNNSFFGYQAGYSNTAGNNNAFFGYHAGYANLTGVHNSFFGYGAGYNTTLGNNSFFGHEAGYGNTSGDGNVFMGDYAGHANTSGNYNTSIGYYSGLSNTSGSFNSFFGNYSTGVAGITNATAIGNRAQVTQSNSLVLGSINGVNSATASTNVGVGTTAPGAKLDIVGLWGTPGTSIPSDWALRTSGRRGVVNGNSGFYEDVYGSYAELSTYKWDNGTTLPLALNANGGNVGIGTTTPGATLDVIGLYGKPGANVPTGWANRVTGRRGVVNGNRGFYEDIIVGPNTYAELSTYKWDDGTTLPLVFNANGGNVGIGTTNPTQKLHVAGNLRVTGQILYGAPDEELPDYVFEPDYELMPVEDLAKFVAKEKHLPNIPAASEIKEKGLNLGEFQMKLLEKIEELTLYTVQQAKENRVLRSENAALGARLAAVEQLLSLQRIQQQK